MTCPFRIDVFAQSLHLNLKICNRQCSKTKPTHLLLLFLHVSTPKFDTHDRSRLKLRNTSTEISSRGSTVFIVSSHHTMVRCYTDNLVVFVQYLIHKLCRDCLL